jgi:DNA helicase II / ATP-dependent DNA helicase PcrA
MLKEFRLPTYLELSKEQDRILRKLQEADKAIVAGAPGTGKSVIVLLLAEKLKNQKKQYLCLLYTQVLKQMSTYLVKDLDVQTWHSWFMKFFFQSYKQAPPRVKAFEYDWNKINEIIDEHHLAFEEESTIIIDEGQDMPPKFYEFMDAHFQTVFVSADENQQLWENNNSCLEDIKERLDVKKEYCFKLSKNYRNSKQIAQLAQCFYCNTSADPPELPERNGEIPMLVDYPEKKVVFEKIALRHKVNPDRLIAILVPNNKIREEYYTELKKMGIDSLYTYASDIGSNNRPIRFDMGGIIVLNTKSAKGLEFDEVFIAALDEFNISFDREAFRKEMYVLISRAKEHLFLLINTCNNTYRCRQILSEFTDDVNVLRRWPENKMESV